MLFCFFNGGDVFSFEAIPQPKGMLFLSPYASFSWHNNPLGGGKYDNKNKVRQMYLGMFVEYGLTDRITIGADTYFAETLKSKNGKIGGKIADNSFSLEYVKLFGRYNFFQKNNIFLSAYVAVWSPSCGTGTGSLSKFSPYNKWSNEFRLETGYKFSNGNSITFNIGYKAQYNQTRDILTFKITYTHKLPFDMILLLWLKKDTYLNKGNNLYAFAQNDKFDLDCFNFINNNGYVAFDIFLMKKIAKGQFIGVAYTHSISAKWLGNKGMHYNYRAFWLEYWAFIKI